MAELPMPPPALANRVGQLTPGEEARQFGWVGATLKGRIVELLPADWSFEGKRVLDFGCGPGKVARQFLAEAEVSEFHACDIDQASVEWLRENLSPPLHPSLSGVDPPLPYADGHFDLIYAISVFTHLVDSWSAWLLELDRVLADDGILIATVMGPARSEEIAGEPWDPDRVGMNAISCSQPWEQGGPMVFHSEWWIRAHWGRCFEIERFEAHGEYDVNDWVVLRKRHAGPTAADLERPEPGEPRELTALAHNVDQLRRQEAGWARQVEQQRAWLEQMRSSASWRITAPLRGLKRLLRRPRD